MDDRIQTLHPTGKQGVNIGRAKYEQVRRTLIRLLRRKKSLTFTELAEAASAVLAGKFDGSITWYVTTVKLDLEARGVIERLPKTTPQRLRLKAPQEDPKGLADH